jgi:hypothetical protein
MKLLIILTVLATTASAFTVRRSNPPPVRSVSTELGLGGQDYDIWGRLQTLEGPSICYGPEGIMIGKPELEIKEYDNFDMFRDALKQAGLDKVLRDTTERYTLLAVVNSGVLAFKEYLDEDILKYHIIKGDVFSDEFTGPIETLNGEFISSRIEFRKAIVDDAFIGQENNHTYGTKYPTDLICENGNIHSIKHILTPGYTAAKNAWTGSVSK